MQQKKIVITGVESTGKTTLATSLALHYHCPLVPEFARDYLTQLNRPYLESDLIEIAYGQLESERQVTGNQDGLVICDTDLTVIKIWSLFKYGRCDPQIQNLIGKNQADLYLLPDIDIPFEPDILRENPFDRTQLFQLYRDELSRRQLPFHILSGPQKMRLQRAIDLINALISKQS